MDREGEISVSEVLSKSKYQIARHDVTWHSIT